MFKSHKTTCFFLVLLALCAPVAQAQFQQQQFPIAVGTVGGSPDPDPFVWVPNLETTTSILVWKDNKELEFGPGELGFFIDSDGFIPCIGVLLDAGLNPIANTAFSGVTNSDAAKIDLGGSIRFSGISVSLGYVESSTESCLPEKVGLRIRAERLGQKENYSYWLLV